MELTDLSAGELGRLYRDKELSPVEVTSAYLKAIEKNNPAINAYITVTVDTALKQAKEAEQMIADGRQAPLTGIPMAIKDLIAIKGIPTTCGSNILKGFTPPFDATVITRLKETGAVFLGKTNMDEFAMGSSNEHSAFGPAKNPWDLTKVPGGSSGGSAAAVAAKLCTMALGSDTGGSIRQPASFCGIVGIKPTYSRVSRYGLVAFASSLDQIGPLGRSVEDCASILNGISGHDPKDSTSHAGKTPDYTTFLNQDLKNFRVGLPKEYFQEGLNPDVQSAVKKAIKDLEDLGAQTVEISLPNTQYVIAAYYVIAPAEASSNLARYDGVKYGFRAKDETDLMEMYYSTRTGGFGPEVIRRIMIGTYVLSAGYYDAYYKKATQVRTLIRNDFEEAFKECDVIASPVAPTTAFAIGQMADDPLEMYLNDLFTLSANMSGIPGMSVPCGISEDGLPIGLQLMADHFREDNLIKAGSAYENVSAFKFGKILPGGGN